MSNSDMSHSDAQYPSSRYAWYMVGMLTIAYVLSFVDRYVFGLLIEPIKADLELTDTQIGLAMGPAFALIYATAGLFLGYLADRTRRTWLVAFGVAFWSLATVLSGFVRNFWQLFLARMSVGAGEATLGPAAMSMISDSFPPEKRGRPIAFYSTAQSLGGGIAALIGASVLIWAKTVPSISLPLVGEVAPWQFTFIVVGLPGLVLAVVMMLMREPKRIGKKAGEGNKSGFTDSIAYVLKRWQVYGGYTLFVCLMTILAYSQGWYAPMFERTWGWKGEQYALANGIVLLAVGPLTVNYMGYLCDKWYAEGRRDAPMKIIVASAFLLVPTQILVPLMPTPWLAIAVLVFNTVAIASISAVALTGLLNITPGQFRGQTVAIYLMVISLTGLFIGPPAVSTLSDFVFGNENLNYACAAVPVIIGLPILLCSRFALRHYNSELNNVNAAS